MKTKVNSYRVRTLRSLLFLFLLAALTVQSTTLVNAHGGGLDGDGGHNCNVGSCAGTYHYHRGGGGSSSGSSNRSRLPSPAFCVALNSSSITQSEVALTQFMLLLKGFSPGPLDGFLGSQTKRAINAYEGKYGLSRSPKNSIYHSTVRHLGIDC